MCTPIGEDRNVAGARFLVLRSLAVFAQVFGGVVMWFGPQLHLGMILGMIVAASGAAVLGLGTALHVYLKKRVATQQAVRAVYGASGAPSLPRRCVLYLRPFDTDGRIEATLVGMHRAVEEAVLEALRCVGPAVALGRPGETAAQPGALRIYHKDAEWKAAVDQYLGECALCVVLAGSTPNLQWEVSRCIGRLSPEKLLVFVPEFDNEKRYALLCQQLAGLIPHAMPAYVRGVTFVRFDQDWRPRLLCTLDAPRWVLANRMAASPARIYEAILGPVYVGLGVPYESPPEGPSKGFVLSLKIVAAAAVLLFLVARYAR
jgi:hypothetical protein